MAALLVRDAPERVHDWLRTTAAENRRSVNRQIIVCLEWCMEQSEKESADFPRPRRLRGGMASLAEIDGAKKAGRR